MRKKRSGPASQRRVKEIRQPNSPDGRAALRHWKPLPKTRRKIRAYLDEDIPKSVAERLRRELRWDVKSVQEDKSLRGRDDEFHYQAARDDDRFLFTLDRDFWDDRRFALQRSPGVFILGADPRSDDDIFHATDVAAMFLREAITKIADLPKGMKTFVTLEGQTIRLTTHDSKVVEIVAPWFL